MEAPAVLPDMQAAWDEAVEVEWLRVAVIVDNVTDMLSEPPDCCKGPGAACSSNERTRSAAAVVAGQAPCFDFSQKMVAAHGLSLLLTAQPVGGGRPRILLFDAGPEGQVWRSNAQRMGVDAAQIEAVVLSHWHMDHSGGLPEVAAMIAEARHQAITASTGAPGAAAAAAQAAPTVFDLHPHRPARRGALLPTFSGASSRPGTCVLGLSDSPAAAAPAAASLSAGPAAAGPSSARPAATAIPYNPDPGLDKLALPGVTEVQLHDEPHTLCGGCFFVSGQIPRQTGYETGNQLNASQWEEGGAWESDPLVLDERFVAVKVKGRGAVVLSACSHAGIVNVMRAARHASGGSGPFAVIGGLHLSTSDCQDRIAATVADVASMAPALVVAGHCSGWRAQAELVEALPGRCMPGSVGCVYEFSAPVTTQAKAG